MANPVISAVIPSKTVVAPGELFGVKVNATDADANDVTFTGTVQDAVSGDSLQVTVVRRGSDVLVFALATSVTGTQIVADAADPTLFHVTAPSAGGPLTLTATVKDLTGNTATQTVSITVQAVAPPPPPPPPPSGSLNEPAGFTPIFATDGSARDLGPNWIKQAKWLDDVYTQVVNDAANPTGSGKAIEKRWYAGQPTNNGNGLITLPRFPFAAREVYMRQRLKFSPNYDITSPATGPKFGYWGADGRPANAAPVQYWTAVTANWRLQFQDQTGAAPNVIGFSSMPVFRRDVWHDLEIVQVAQSAPDAADGKLFLFVDRALVYSNVAAAFVRAGDGYSNTKLSGIQLFYIRGFVNNVFAVDDWLRIGELYISGKP